MNTHEGFNRIPYSIYSSKYVGLDPEPVNPKYRALDSEMQLGYKYAIEDNPTEATRVWLGVWNSLMDAMAKESIEKFRAFDRVFNGNQYITNWINDFEDLLFNAISNTDDIQAINVYGNIRIKLNEEIQKYVDDTNLVENAKRSVAETYFSMGNKEKGEMLFQDYLKADPEWGWGWIGWSDQYWLFKEQDADYKRGEDILFKALTIPGLRDKEDVEERLLDLYHDSGEEEKYKALEKKINNTNNNNQKEKKASIPVSLRE